MNESTFTTVFGPVTSRRFGRSLGVDIIPRKLCSLDCVYCEVGPTDKRGIARKEYVSADTILRELSSALPRHTDLECVTYSGSGEPTLHSRLGYLLQETRTLTPLPLTVLTNGTLLWQEDVRTDLLQADIVCPSLNAVSEDIFRRINRPHPALTAELVLQGLVAFRDMFDGKYFLEILFVSGLNDGDEEVQALRRACDQIHPDRIHVNTVVRPPAEPWAQPVPRSRLKDICARLGPSAEILVSHDPVPTLHSRPVCAEEIMSLLGRRAMSLHEIAVSLSADDEHVKHPLQKLVSSGAVHPVDHDGRTYFAASGEPELT